MGKVHEVNGIGTTIFMTKRVEELDLLHPILKQAMKIRNALM